MAADAKRKDYQDATPQWTRLRDTYDGRDAVLARGNVYVPDLRGLDDPGNANYRKRGNFYNCVKRTVHGLVGAIFQKDAKIVFPATMASFLTDVTLTNVTFGMFAVETGRETMLMGRYGVLVDMPSVEDPGNRPYLCPYKAEEIVNWRTVLQAGDEILSMVVLCEHVEEVDPKDEFKIICTEQYRVCELKNGVYIQRLFRQHTNATTRDWVQYGPTIEPKRRGEPLNFIPFVFVGATHSTPNIVKPPLLDLADINLAHWRNSVDYEYGLHLVALPTPWAAGVKNSSSDGTMKIGPSVIWELELQGSAGMLEFSGAGLDSILEAMNEKKKEMAVIGARMLEDVPVVDETATAVQIRRSGEGASLHSIADAVEQALTFVLQIVVWWQSTVDVPTEAPAKVELNKEFFNVKISAGEVTAALGALQADEISFETWWNLLSTGGWARDGVAPEDELKLIAKRIAARPPEPVAPLPEPVKPAPTKKRTVKDSTGKVKYEIEETQ